MKTHLGHAYDKLGVGGRVQLALLAREAGAGCRQRARTRASSPVRPAVPIPSRASAAGSFLP